MTGAVFAPSLPPPCHPRPFLRFFLAPTTPKRRENNKGEGEEDLLPSPPSHLPLLILISGLGSTEGIRTPTWTKGSLYPWGGLLRVKN